MNLKQNYEKACNAYVDELCRRYDLDKDDSFWVVDQVGGILIIGDLSISFLDIVYIIDNNVKWETFIDWYDYRLRLYCINEKEPAPNLKNWCNGCPRKSDKELSILEEANRRFEELNNEIDIATRVNIK